MTTTDVNAIKKIIAERVRARHARKLGLTPIAFEVLREWQENEAAWLMAGTEAMLKPLHRVTPPPFALSLDPV